MIEALDESDRAQAEQRERIRAAMDAAHLPDGPLAPTSPTRNVASQPLSAALQREPLPLQREPLPLPREPSPRQREQLFEQPSPILTPHSDALVFLCPLFRNNAPLSQSAVLQKTSLVALSMSKSLLLVWALMTLKVMITLLSQTLDPLLLIPRQSLLQLLLIIIKLLTFIHRHSSS
jgi:hypothetical protein